MRSFGITVAAVLALALGLAACSDSTPRYGGAGSSTSTSSAASGGAAAVDTASVGDLGTVLVDGSGRTLYLFESDTGSTSTCTGTCAGTWPAMTTTGDPTAGMGASASMLGTTTRDDGSTQVTYNGHPLYRFAGDQAPGDTNGQGVGGIWWVVSPAGDPIES